jgi:hypothetical protein
MAHGYLFFAPHPALNHAVNNIMVGHTITNGSQANLSFPFPPLPEHSILFYPHAKPTVENRVTKKYMNYMLVPLPERLFFHLGATTTAQQKA